MTPTTATAPIATTLPSLRERWEAAQKMMLANASEEFLTMYNLMETGDVRVVSDEELQELRRKYNLSE